MVKKILAFLLMSCLSLNGMAIAWCDNDLDDDIIADYTYVPVDTTISAKVIEKDITSDPYTKFRPTKLILPGALIAVGSWGVCNGWFSGIRDDVKDGMEHLRGGHYIHIDDYIQYLPAITYLGLGSAGVKSRLRFKERLVAAATATIAMTIMTNGIKYTVGEKRPDSSARNSFPSGHTATVFMGAELMRMEYSTGIAVGAYAVAFGTAFLRMYNERHWLNDVIAGAGIGILSARIGYWLLPFNRRLFRINPRSDTFVAALPNYDPFNRAFGMSLTASF